MLTQMDRGRRPTRALATLAIVTALALAVAACSGDDDSDTSDSGADAAGSIAADDAETTEPSTSEAPTSDTTSDTAEAGPGPTDAVSESTDASSESTDASSTETAADTTSDMSAEEQATVEAAIAAGMARVDGYGLTPPALYVGIWDPATGSYLTAQGEAEPGRAATLDDHYRIGSTTKTFTAGVVLQLVDEGELSLDDTIGTLLPDLAAAHPEIADITVESLLRMKSGIQDYLNVSESVVADVVADPARVWAPEELIDAALQREVEPEGTPGYSTTNFIILQLIAESITGTPLPELIRTRLLEPLGMSESSLPIDDPSLPEPYAAGSLNGGCVLELLEDGATDVDLDTDPTDWTISYAQGGGGMTSTLSDLGLWADSNSGNTFLGPDLQTARLDADSPIQGPEIYGLGILQLGDNWYGHPGEAIGWQSLVLHDPETGVSVAFASNVCNGEDLLYWSILNELYPNPALDEFLTSQGV